MLTLRLLGISSFTGEFRAETLVVTGFIIVTAFTMGELLKRVGLPSLLGYIVTGIIFGPNFASLIFNSSNKALFSQDVTDDLALISVLTVGIIGTMGGGELKISELKANLRTIIAIVIILVPSILILVTGLILGLSYLAPNIIVFLKNEPLSSRIAAALLFSIFTIGMSPSVTLAVIQDLRAKGLFTSLVLGIVVVADLALVALFLVGMALSKLMIRPEGIDLAAFLAALPAIVAEFAWSLVLGVIIGIVFILYLRFINREKLLFTILIIFAGSYASSLLHAETLLVFLTAGFCVQNFSRHGHTMIHALESIGLPVFVIYFTVEALKLDIKAVAAYVPLTIILVASRCITYYVGISLANKLAKPPENFQQYLWMCFFPKGGVDLVLAAIVVSNIPSWGQQFQTVTLATILIYIIGGPLLLKFALDRTGETEEARQKGSAEVAELDKVLDNSFSSEPTETNFSLPNIENKELKEKLLDLRQEFIDIHQRKIAEPINQLSTKLKTTISKIEDINNATFQKLEKIIQDTSYLDEIAQASAIRDLQVSWRLEIQNKIDFLTILEPLAINTFSTEEILTQLRGRLSFEENIQIAKAAKFFEINTTDRLHLRLIKRLRKIRQLILRHPGYRSISLGRLWRYYIELFLPIYLATGVANTSRHNEKLWYLLGYYLKQSDLLFENIAGTLEKQLFAETKKVEINKNVETQSNNSGEKSLSPDKKLLAPSPIALFEQGKSELQTQAKLIQDSLTIAIKAKYDHYTWSLQKALENFFNAVGKAGTVELPAFRYRPSKEFDRAQRAENHLIDILKREQSIVYGYRSWLIFNQTLVIFRQEFLDYQKNIIITLNQHLEKSCHHQIALLKKQFLTEINRLGNKAEDTNISYSWKELSNKLLSQINQTQHKIEQSIVMVKAELARSLLAEIEERIYKFADELEFLEQDPNQLISETANPKTLTIAVRQWFITELAREIALRLIELSERMEKLLEDSLTQLHHIDQVINFNFRTIHKDTSNSSQAINNIVDTLKRVEHIAEQLCDSLDKNTNQLRAWIYSETDLLFLNTTKPFLQYRLTDIQNIVSQRRQQIANITKQANTLEPIKNVTKSFVSQFTPIYGQVTKDLQSILNQSAKLSNNAKLKLLSSETSSQVPTSYSRMFTPTLLDIPDFYVSRPELEAKCLIAIEQWLAERPTSILLYGDRGVGKNTFLQHLLHTNLEQLQSQLARRHPLHIIRLSEEVETEAQLSVQLTQKLTSETFYNLNSVEQYLQNLEDRQIIVIENGNKLFLRTSKGIDLCRSFLQMMSSTSDKTLWIVLLNEGAATLLNNTTKLFDFFTHVFKVEPMNSVAIEKVIRNRHWLSGFKLDFPTTKFNTIERLQHPISTSNALKDPAQEFFKRLYKFSEGYPLLALLYWSQAVELHPVDSKTTIQVNTLPDREVDLTSELSTNKKLLLTCLIQHGSLSIQQLEEILFWPKMEIEKEIYHLVRFQFVEKISSTPQRYEIKTLIEPIITKELRAANLV